MNGIGQKITVQKIGTDKKKTSDVLQPRGLSLYVQEVLYLENLFTASDKTLIRSLLGGIARGKVFVSYSLRDRWLLKTIPLISYICRLASNTTLMV